MTEADFRRADLALNFAEVSDIGGRQSNQDAHSHVVQDGLALFVIADGWHLVAVALNQSFG